MAFYPTGYPTGYNYAAGSPGNVYGYNPLNNPANQPGAAYQQTAAGSAGMSLPTIHAEIVQVDDEAAAANFPVAANGSPQMMIRKDDKEIYIKTAYSNGTYDLDVYEKRKPSSAPSPYISREEFEAFRAELLGAIQPAQEKTEKRSKNE